ncbi:MAG: hypothetical protein ACK4V1_10575, partial [Burkholderiaceae bacterium]
GVLDSESLPARVIGAPPRPYRALHDPRFVDRWLQRIRQCIEHPVEVAWIGGERHVQVLGQAILRFAADGTITPYLWTLGDDAVCVQAEADLINLAGMPHGWLWLDRFRDAFQRDLVRHCGESGHLAAAYAAWVFQRFRSRLRRDGQLASMRRRVAEALALDTAALAIARRIELDGNPSVSVRISTYNEVIAYRADYEKLTRECPGLVPLYATLREVLPPGGEPAARLRRHVIRIGLSPATWRVIHHGDGRLLRLLSEFYIQPCADAAEDLLRIVDMLAPSVQPPTWFVRTLLYYFGNFGQRRHSYFAALRSLAAPLRRLLALAERAGSEETAAMREHLYEVVTWLIEDRTALAHPHARKASWRWFERKAQAWEQTKQHAARLDPGRWATPFERIEMDGITVLALSTPLSLWEESRSMRHCARKLEPLCRTGTALLFSIRRHGRSRPLATMLTDFAGVWSLTQVAACANTVAPPAAQRVAQRVVDLLNAQGWMPGGLGLTGAPLPHAALDDDAVADRPALLDAAHAQCTAMHAGARRSRPADSPPDDERRIDAMNAQMTLLPDAAAKASFASWSTPKRVGCPRTRPRSARFVAQVDLFSQSPVNQRSDAYWLSTNRKRSHWFLWIGYYDDEMGSGWVYQVYAYMPRRGVDARRAAMTLLECGWRAERDRETLSQRPEGVSGQGLLKAKDIEAIARAVWPDSTGEDIHGRV